MDAADINVLFIAYQVLREGFPIDNLPLVLCANVDQVNDTVNQNRHYEIILIGKASDLQQLSHLFGARCFDDIWTLGEYKGINTTNRPMTTIEGDEKKLMFEVINKIIYCGNQKEIKLETIENDHQQAKDLRHKIIRLTDLLNDYF